MTHYEERLDRDLTQIREEIRSVAARIQKALERAVHALLHGDKDLAYSVVLGDLAINRQTRQIDRLCHSFVALHLPSAGHLRFVSSVLRLDRELERMGDYAVTLSREAVQLTEIPPPAVKRDVELLAHQSGTVLRQSVQAFDTANVEMARATMSMAVQVRTTFRKVFHDLLEEGADLSPPLKDLFGLLVIFNSLERVADRAKNICEETVFAVTGETKEPKVYRILFVDECNDFLSPMAEVFARKAFPESGRYASAGWNPAAQFSPDFKAFMEANGHNLSDRSPARLDLTLDELARYHVIVALKEGVREHIPSIPFQTVLLRWDCVPEGLDSAAEPDAYQRTAYQNVTVKVRELMETLRGEEAR